MRLRLAVTALILALAAPGAHASPASPAPGPQVPPQRRITPATGTASVIGRVLAADTGTPVRSATVVLSAGAAGTWTATTDGQGGFSFAHLPAGRFTLRVTKGGFAVTTFGGAPRGRGVTAIVLRDGEKLDRGDLPLPRGGVIAGRVVDEFGEPMVDVYVAAMRQEYLQPGDRRIVSTRSTQTNDLGEFRLHGLPSGRYYVMASLRMMQAVGGGAPPQQILGASRGIAPSFYPGTTSAADAQAIAVAAGEVRPGTDIQLLSVPLAILSGTVVDSRGQPAPRMAVMLNPARLDGALISQMNITETDAAGRFRLPNVAPGDYRIDVESVARMEAIGETGSIGSRTDADEFASHPVSVRGDDLTDLTIQTGRGFGLTGRMLVEGGALTPAQLRMVRVSAFPLLPGQGVSGTLLTASGTVQADATFAIAGVSGPRLVRVSGLPPGHVLKAVRVFGSDVTDGGFEVREDLGGLDIVVTARPTELVGRVTDAAGEALLEYGVIVFPDDRGRWTARMNRYVTAARPQPDGQFKIVGLPPGRYLAVAVDTLADGEWAEPDSLDALRAAATRLDLAEGQTRTVTLVRR